MYLHQIPTLMQCLDRHETLELLVAALVLLLILSLVFNVVQIREWKKSPELRQVKPADGSRTE